MQSFKNFLQEKDISWTSVSDKMSVFLEGVLNESKKLGSEEIIYRGHGNGGTVGGVLYVTNDRSGFYGSLNPNTVALLKELKIENVTFAAREFWKAKMFGSPYVFVPIGNFEAYQSKEHVDLHASFGTTDPLPKEDIKKAAATFVKGLGDINKYEIIFDIKSYYLINIDYILKELDKYNKFQKIKPGQVRTYKDLSDALKSVISFMKFKEKKDYNG